MPEQIPPIKQILELACEGTTITFKQLFSALSTEEIADAKAGQITIEDLKEIINELIDINTNIDQYRVPTGKNQSDDIDH